MTKAIRRGTRGLKYLFLMVAIAVLVLTPTIAQAATTQDVEISATPTFISISNAPTWFDFGNVAAGATNATVNTTAAHFTVTNDSTVNINTTIKVTSDWEGGANDWTYGAPAEDTGRLVASDGDAAYDVLVEGQAGAAVGLNVTAVAGDDFDWELGLDAPSSFTFGNAQNCTVQLSASAA